MMSIRLKLSNWNLWKFLSSTAMEASNAINSESDFTSPTADEILKKKWEREQNELKKKLLLEDVDDWSKFRITADVAEQFPKKSYLKYVGGVDLSFIKGDDINACAAFVVLKLPELKVIYQDLSMVQLTAPYVPGFLAFREVNSLQDKIDKLKNTQPDILPQVILVDGNGILHPRGFGLACHLGVLTNLPTIGIAKNLLCVDGIERDDKFKQKIQTLQNAGDWLPLIGLSGKQHGMAYRSCKETSNPIYISPGHKISMDTAIWVVQKCIKYRIPEPTRQADILSREYIRSLFDKEENVKKPSTRKKKSGKAEKRNERGEAKHSEMSDDDDDESYFDSGINLWDS